MSDCLTPETLKFWLEWASARLLAIPSSRIKPQDSSVIWPEYSQDRFEILDFRANIMLRALAPSSAEIPLMDEILLLPNLCFSEKRRRAIRLRSLVNPVNNHHLFSWARLAERLSSDPKSVKRLYLRGIEEVSRKVPRDQVCRISTVLYEDIPTRQNIA